MANDSIISSRVLKDANPSIKDTSALNLNQALAFARSSETEQTYITSAKTIKTLAEQTAMAVLE